MGHRTAWTPPLLRFGHPILLCLFALFAWCPSASAQVNRCEHPDGTVAYTDRRCSDVGAIQRETNGRRNSSHRIYRGGCARNVQDLLFEMTTAIDGGDVNRLASVYHWPGMSSGNATRIMQHLDAVVHRPLIDIVPVVPEPTPPPLRIFRGGELVIPAPDAVPMAAREPKPVALRVIQTLENRSTPSETVFRLHSYFGCLWIRN